MLSRDPSLSWNVRVHVCNIAILRGGDVIAACMDGLRVYDAQNGKKIKHPISDMSKGSIRCVSVGDDGATVAAVEVDMVKWGRPGRLHIYTSVNGRWSHQKYKTCARPRSVACTADRHFIVGNNDNFLYKYTTHGHLLWKNKLSFCPWYISTDHRNRILVSNINNGCVTVYNSADGMEMLSFPAATDQRKLKPQGVCVDDEDNILVADEDSKSLLLYNPSGKFLKTLIDLEEGDPYCVALYRNTHLATRVCHGSGSESNVCLYKL